MYVISDHVREEREKDEGGKLLSTIRLGSGEKRVLYHESNGIYQSVSAYGAGLDWDKNMYLSVN